MWHQQYRMIDVRDSLQNDQLVELREEDSSNSNLSHQVQRLESSVELFLSSHTLL
tara:strand:- start:80330 stop:80494 length:165 start_codon:yes stop_codon:yes gene_type:complete